VSIFEQDGLPLNDSGWAERLTDAWVSNAFPAEPEDEEEDEDDDL
jgi:hypothetical protein